MSKMKDNDGVTWKCPKCGLVNWVGSKCPLCYKIEGVKPEVINEVKE